MAAAGNNDFKLFGPHHKEYQSGSAVTLSCHLSPEISDVAMEIRWFKGTDCVCLYKNRQVTEGRGYEGRVSLFTEELQRGNVSLQIRDCRWSDRGDYLCQVTNGDTTEECTVEVGVPWLHVRRCRDARNTAQERELAAPVAEEQVPHGTCVDQDNLQNAHVHLRDFAWTMWAAGIADP
ncbi:hypothetical protein AOLI_G00270640 [Acnodon oligacanthus]